MPLVPKEANLNSEKSTTPSLTKLTLTWHRLRCSTPWQRCPQTAHRPWLWRGGGRKLSEKEKAGKENVNWKTSRCWRVWRGKQAAWRRCASEEGVFVLQAVQGKRLTSSFVSKWWNYCNNTLRHHRVADYMDAVYSAGRRFRFFPLFWSRKLFQVTQMGLSIM